jgi:signal transduction histidine kinase
MGKFEQSYSFCLKAQAFFDKELKNKLNPNDKIEIYKSLFSLNNNNFIALNNLDRPDESLKYLKKALECANEIDDKVSIAKVLTNTANYYERKGNLDSSMHYAKLGLEHCIKYDLKQGIAINYSNLAIFNMKKRNFSEAVKYGETCLDFIEKERFEYLKSGVLMSLANCYDTLGNHKKALKYFRELLDIKDSAYDKETNDKIEELNIQYQIEKKEEIETDLLEKQKYSNYVFILLIIIVAVIAIGLYIRYNEKSKSHKLLESKSEEIKLQNDQLFDLNATKDKFFSIIAHDLKGPLGNFNNVIDLLISQFNSLDENERLDFLKLIKESSQNIYNLLINLLDWSKAQRNLIKLELTQFPIDYYVKNTLNLLSPIAKTKSIELKKIINDDLIINGDVNLLTTVLRNLVSNALKYTPNGGSVTVSSEIKDKEILISVRDTGVGMSKKILDGLFKVESTSSMPGTNDETGTGLGLILCKEFVEFHNGKIWVESAVGKGSTFFYTIPK